MASREPPWASTAKVRKATSQDQANLKLTYDFTPDLRGGLDVGYWSQDLSHRTASYLRDANGQTVLAGSVAIDGRQYVIPASFFAPSTRRSENYQYGLSLGTHRDSGWNVQAQASYFDRDKSQDRSASSTLTDDGAGQITLGDGSRWRTFDLRSSYRPDIVDAGQPLGQHGLSLRWLRAGQRHLRARAVAPWHGRRADQRHRRQHPDAGDLPAGRVAVEFALAIHLRGALRTMARV